MPTRPAASSSVSRELAAKKRSSCRRSGDIGFSPSSAALDEALVVLGRQIATQGSTPLASTTPSLSAARNFAGTVSRFFASSE